jgi:hypothetical protein
MLDKSSYLMAVYIYTGAAGVLVLYVGWWLSRLWRPAWVCLAVLLLAALLLTPAYPDAGVETMAPALVVFGFKLMTVGMQGAVYALRPLVFMCAVAVALTVLLKLLFFRRGKARKTPSNSSGSGARAHPGRRARRA